MTLLFSIEHCSCKCFMDRLTSNMFNFSGTVRNVVRELWLKCYIHYEKYGWLMTSYWEGRKKKTFAHTESSAMNASQKNNYLKAQICIFLEYSWPHLGWWSPWWPWRCLQWGRCPHWLRRPSQTWRLGLHLQREFWFWVNLHVDTLWPHH